MKKKLIIVFFACSIFAIILGIFLLLNSTKEYKEKENMQNYCFESEEEVKIYLEEMYKTENITKFEYSSLENDKYIFNVYNKYSSHPDLYYIDRNTCQVEIISIGYDE